MWYVWSILLNARVLCVTHFSTFLSASISLSALYYVTGGKRELAERNAGAVRVRKRRPVRGARRLRLCRGLDRVSSTVMACLADLSTV
jgi:hypothetical protein